ncbi:MULTISPECIES: IPT/TIG domain-containing protein [Niastella]|uniref:IPT/TIG domain-containing protein n=1 Tax=Niastella soli TaxID=2821487 RepID=A0ABS3Z0H5_9BACT|nr:IPT/TIG domain-containing protein [Niastella soli]MBO9203518.1 IPT/TIG domain-containing protein [Niastella soli]
MKQKLFLLFALFSMSLLFSCSKSDSGDTPKDETIAFYAISQKLYNGTVVTLTGYNFGTDTSQVKLTLDGKKMIITAMTNTSLTFTIPQDFLPSGQKDCTLEISRGIAYIGTQSQVMVYYLEPHGWFYPTTLTKYSSTNSQTFTDLIFPTDSIGYAIRYRELYMTADGGISWRRDGSDVGVGKAVASSDGKNVWIEFIGSVGISADAGANWKIGANGSSFNSQIVGLYTTGAANGLSALIKGQLYDINGSFTGAAVKYQSSFYNGSDNLWQKMSVIDKNNLIIAGNSKNVVLEKAGAFSEVDISSVSSSATVKALQLVDPNTAFLVNGNNELIKYAGNTWTKLTQPAYAVYFTNTTTGYIGYNNKILKTTDGGASWKEEFTLNAADKVDVLCARNGKVWAFGNNDAAGFVLKYNP